MKTILRIVIFSLVTTLCAHAQWVQQGYFPGAILNLKTINSQVAWGAVYSSTGVIRTTDGGATWNATNTGSIFSNFALSISLAARTADTAWFLAQGSPPTKMVYKTTDGGLNWQQQQIPPGRYPYGIHFFDSRNGIVLGSDPMGLWDFYTTSNGGTTWTAVSLANLPTSARYGYSHRNAFAVHGNTIWFTGQSQNNMVLLKSTDRGLTWNLTSLALPSLQTRPFPETIAFKDQNNGLIAMDSILLRTSDGGTSWQRVNYSGPLCSTHIIHIPGTASTYLAVGSDIISGSVNRGSAVSTDNGNTWTLLDTDAHMGSSFLSPVLGWTGGTNFVYKFSGSPLGISKITNTAASNFLISPNPGTGIFTINNSSFHPFTLEVYNMWGAKILQQKSKLFGNTRIDITSQPKGMYLVKISSRNQVTTHKIILQ